MALPSFQLPKLFPTFNPEKIEIHDDVKALMKKPPKPKKEELPRFFTYKERVIVGGILAVTIGFIALFWFKGGGQIGDFTIPSLNLGGFGVNETIIIE